jgi:hypothetical protein
MSGHRRERLDIAFELDGGDTEEIQIGANRLGRIVRANGISDIQALRMIVGAMQQFDMTMEFSDQGKQISVESYLKQVEKQGKWSRAVEAGGLSIRFGRVPALKHGFISIEEMNAGSVVSWVDWVKPFLAVDSFVQAWVSDVEYDHWQNAKDPLQYEAAGRSYAHLPTKSNGLPPPLEQIEIDTSNNPGRWSLQSGYIEAIGSIMWLGAPFWKYVGENCKAALFSASWLDVQPVGNAVTQVIASEHCFCDGTTEDIQRKLRSVLYG